MKSFFCRLVSLTKDLISGSNSPFEGDQANVKFKWSLSCVCLFSSPGEKGVRHPGEGLSGGAEPENKQRSTLFPEVLRH